jgi:hypothetical protein
LFHEEDQAWWQTGGMHSSFIKGGPVPVRQAPTAHRGRQGRLFDKLHGTLHGTPGQAGQAGQALGDVFAKYQR